MILLLGAVVWGVETVESADDEAGATPTIHPAVWPAVRSPVPHDPELARRVADLLDRLTVDEKVGQIIDAEIRYVTPEDMRRYRPGSVLNGGSVQPGGANRAAPEDWLALADSLWEASMDTSGGGHGIPVLWGTDAMHGRNNVVGATIFPHNIGLGATRNPELMRKIGQVTATEVAVTGLDWTFAPTLAVVRDDRWGRTYEGFSQDPEVVRAYAGEMIKGLQGVVGDESFLDGHHVIATAKHFIRDGGTVGDKDTGDSLSTVEELRDIHGAGYVVALETPGDRDTLDYGRLRPDDLALLNELRSSGIPVVSIFISGRPMWVNPELNASDAFVAAWLPGSEGGGVADVIFRGPDGSIEHHFSGKLSHSWPRTAVQTPLNRGDDGYSPLFPYGFGLTYGDHWDLRELPEASGLEGWTVGMEVFTKDSILQTMERVADWQLEHLVYEAPLPDGGTQEVSDTEWVRGAFFAGVMAAHRATGNETYLNVALELGEKNRWQPGPRPRHADDHCIAQTYCELYMTRRDPRMIAPIVERLDAMVAEPRPAAAVGWSADDNWSWCDALFMAPPTMAMVAEATGDRAYLDLMNTMWWETHDYLYDREEHLWYRDGNFTVQPDGTQPRTPNGEKIFWGRGNGWVLAGLARVMEHMPADYPDRPRYEVLMREMAARLIQIQGADGLWRSSLLDPEQYPAPEASCTGFFAYGLAWGVNHGILDRATYLPAVERAWRGLVWAVQPGGKLGWVQQIGYDPRSVSADDSMEYGSGAFLLAASEIAKIDWVGWWLTRSESSTQRPTPGE
jgi:rhamnogalacturonyl hydrolase YesR